jgi:mannan endo-1,4-beta-mannosidase
MITWESWDPKAPRARCSKLTPKGLCPAAIARGSQDGYIRRQARAVKAYRKTVYIRLDHEMNGNWYPWNHAPPRDYVRMWRHVWGIFHRAHVRNVRWIWSPNLNTFWSDAKFDSQVKRWWPGSRYVNVVGATVTRVLVQGSFYAGPAWFFQRMDRLLRYRKPIWITEAMVDRQEMAGWMPGFRREVDSRPWIKGVIWLSTVIRQDPAFGNMTWMLSNEPVARHYLTWRPGFRP